MDNIQPLLDNITPLGLVGLMIVLGYFGVNKIATILTEHYERQTQLLNQINVTMMACAQRLQDIEESFHDLSK